MPSLETIWKELQESYRKEMNPVSYNTWIEPAKPISFYDNQLIIEVPTTVQKNYWEKNLAGKILETFFMMSGEEILPTFVTPDEAESYKQTETKKEESTTKTPEHRTMLNSKYTFDTFVIGKGNQMAHAAALVVAEDPGSIYNPLFFYGGVGLGKTHLTQAIGHQMLVTHPNAKIKYVSSENFTNDFINSIQKNKMEEFRNEYRTVDLLLVDDIQFLVNKEGTQEEFFNTFEELYRNNKQIVLTSDRLPNEIPTLPQRLVSRFAWGLSVDITPPDLETRTAILRKKAEAENLEIPDDTLSYIAGQIDSNIRELEGALVRVQAYAAIQSSDITTSLAAEALKALKVGTNLSQLTVEQIQEEVSDYYHLHVSDLKGKKRTKGIVVPRQIAMYLCRELTDYSLPKVGAEFGGKDHTTVIHAYEKIHQLIKEDQTIQNEVTEIKNHLME
ncbi:chromosomal replication initiator protein DnaA [Tetragenococcus koreensis]|uniref:Chromosomal replication initiator protein DnaA n=1 Tax=Tetragenococcus koreensis TaxID=290335 RepID=A0AAN4ZNN5_9ENTE|nr:chromosomal replication initiator protein DnaA [Tetragenococcus koreensis]AYW46332.1 chromosomal replication initiator protein DnaA [Tetragenococcus koreensis]MCF1586056.1 chromosomal replication initiator protein DnaA [Tetragenococcus koreensis]MCF1614864.1 chromosomal replication initiator protein DnaA [Tetragenococcus koreensis]MCF1616969.1 chromosomal replication initiator protein DnaA [Tetragenococcus koreensis]MCF1619357.1 chromosomal replication initiator protein DnaA [Tetragenococcu